jgi:AcrR family transcriptional regulator
MDKQHEHAHDGPPPDPVRPGPRAATTRDDLIAAATEVFGETGFTNATISEISRRAGRAHGSFYTYFNSKEAVFLEVIRLINGEEHARREGEAPAHTPEHRIARSNDRFVETYRRHARILAAYEELAARDEETQRLRSATRLGYIDRSIASIEAWQRDGLVDADLDAEAIAHCLGSMVERVAHMKFVFGDGPEQERIMAAISDIWCAALGLSGEEGRGAARSLAAMRAGGTS